MVWWLVIGIPVCAVIVAFLLRHLHWTSLKAKFDIFILGCEASPELRWTYVQRTPGGPLSHKLLVAFAGGAVRVGGLPLAEFGRTAMALHDNDVLLVTDPTQLWYLRDEPRWRREFSALFALYNGRVMLVGNCLGATAALLYRDLAQVVVAFQPQTTLTSGPWNLYRLNALRLPQVRHTKSFSAIALRARLELVTPHRLYVIQSKHE